MIFYTCVSKYYRDLVPIYKFCVNRAYPNAKVIVDKEPHHPACKRFINEIEGDYVHVTDADIFILPHNESHEQYYKRFAFNGACYLRGATKSGDKEWRGDNARIAGGHVGFTPEYYTRTRKVRSKYSSGMMDGYREFDEVMLARILRESGYKIPKDPYTFYNGEKWNIEYRDLHLNDFASMKFLKWRPDREKVKEMIFDPHFRKLVKNIDSYWRTLFHKVEEYITGPELSC